MNSPTPLPKAWQPYLLAGLPALVFYFLLARSVGNLPIVDDYHAVLDFLNRFSQLPDLGSRLAYIVNFQHNEYKLMFESAIFATQYSLLGHVDFAVLSMLGNSFVLILYVLLAAALRTQHLGNAGRTLALLPIALLIFQLQYASTLNFSMAGLQNIPVLAFSLLSISLLAKDSASRFSSACAAMLLAITASGSGFLLAPVGVLMLLERRRWRDALIWAAVIAAAALVYFSNYNSHTSQSDPDGSVAQSAAHFSIAYMLSFIGSSVARYQGYTASMTAGVVLLLIWGLAAKQGYSKKNPTAFYFVVFLLLTAAGVSAIRSGLGLEQSLASRYRIYSNLLLILSYIFLAETYLLQSANRRTRHIATGLVILASLGFFTLSNIAGYRFLNGRQQAAAYEMAAWQARTLSSGTAPDPSAIQNLDPAVTRQLAVGIHKPATETLLESIRLGIYQPPGPTAPQAGH